MTEATDKIRDTEIELFNMNQRNRTISNDMEEIKSSYAFDVESEWTNSKDPELSNQTKRNAAVAEHLKTDEKYNALSEENGALNEDIALLSIDLSHIKRVERRKLSDVDMLPFTALERIAVALEHIEARTGVL